MSRYGNPQRVLKAAEHWKATSLLSNGGVLGNQGIWSTDCLQELETVVKQLPSKDFYENLGSRLERKRPEIIQLAAETCWFVHLSVHRNGMSPPKKREKIKNIWEKQDHPFPENSEWLSDEVFEGIGHPGTAFNVNIQREWLFFIHLTVAFKGIDPPESSDLLSDGWKFAEWVEHRKIPGHEIRTLRHMILFLLFPDDFERVFSAAHKKEIIHKFRGQTKAQIRNLSPTSIDRHILDIRHQEEREYPDTELDFYGSPLKESG